MARIDDIEIATAFGALDGDAVVDGRGLDALTLRTMGMQANRLISVGQQAFNLVWPQVTQSLEGVSQYSAEWQAPVDWSLLVPPIPIEKLPGLTTGTVHIRANIPSGGEMLFAVETGADTNGRTENAARFVGTGSLDTYSISGVRFLPGGYDEARIYCRTGDSQGTLLTTGTYGTPNEATLGAVGTDTLDLDTLTDVGAAWSTSPTIASGQHNLVLISDYGTAAERVEAVRRIVWNSATVLRFARDPQGPILGLVNRWLNGATVRYQIRTGHKFNLTQILGVLDSRTG